MVQLGFSRPARRLFVAALALAAVLAGGGQARAELRVCNQTLNLYNVAIGYFSGTKFYTEGWWTLPANACVTPRREDLDNRFYYFFAMDLYGNDATEGERDFCVDVNKGFRFALPSDDLERPACWVRGFQQVKFKEIDTGEGAKSWTVFITQKAS